MIWCYPTAAVGDGNTLFGRPLPLFTDEPSASVEFGFCVGLILE
jgi:hypothetical protein